jgi:hypothetical protein
MPHAVDALGVATVTVSPHPTAPAATDRQTHRDERGAVGLGRRGGAQDYALEDGDGHKGKEVAKALPTGNPPVDGAGAHWEPRASAWRRCREPRCSGE